MYDLDNREFLFKVFEKSGISPTATYLPANLHPTFVKEPQYGIPESLKEANMVMGGAVEALLESTGLQATDVDILITTTSIFCPTPSLSSLLINKFKMRHDVQAYHLGGMGCSNGVVAINLVRDMLKARPNSNCLFVAAEIVSYCYYPGKDKARMVANAIFRMGGAAMMFTNKPALRSRSKYELVQAVRVHRAADDESYFSMDWGPDAEGINGVYLSKSLVGCAGKAVEQTIRLLAPSVMTWRQYGEYITNAVQRYLGYKDVAPYKPKFQRGVDHFLIHAGGYAVLKGIQQGMALEDEAMVPSFAGLREYGNTSCSTTWYALAYVESTTGLKKGEIMLQLGVGGGVKAGACVWRALRTQRTVHPAWAHLADTPLTIADLPRNLKTGNITDPRYAQLDRYGVNRETGKAKADAKWGAINVKVSACGAPVGMPIVAQVAACADDESGKADVEKSASQEMAHAAAAAAAAARAEELIEAAA